MANELNLLNEATIGDKLNLFVPDQTTPKLESRSRSLQNPPIAKYQELRR